MQTRKERSPCITPQVICGLLCAILLVGCASTGPSLKVYDDPSDACNTFRQPLIETEVDLRAWTVGGAAAGAVVGGVLAALLGGDAAQVAGVAAAGAVVGGTAGYLAAREKQNSTQEELLAAIENDAMSDSKKVQQVTAAIERLWACRQRQIENVRVQFEEGEISKAIAISRANDIQTANDKDNQLVEQVMGRIDKRYSTYVDAKAEVLGADRPTVEPEVEPVIADEPAPAGAEQDPFAEFALAPATGEFKIKKTANIRNGPSTEADKITVLNAGETISIKGRTKDGNWYAFMHGEKPAFIYRSLVEEAGMQTPETKPPTDALEALALDTLKAKAAQEKQKKQTDQSLEELNLLLS